MKYAIYEGQKIEASAGFLGATCQVCESKVVAKCGNKKIHHWAHASIQVCDKWGENETEWHRSWKDNFPKHWQEIVHFDESGEKHITDIKTPKGLVVEVQHSYICDAERESRNKFYKNIIWVVDGLRGSRLRAQFIKGVKEGDVISEQNGITKVFTGFCIPLRDWGSSTSSTPIFFDFGPDEKMWCLIPSNDSMYSYVMPVYREFLISLINNDGHENKLSVDFLISTAQACIWKRNLPVLPTTRTVYLSPVRRHFRL